MQELQAQREFEPVRIVVASVQGTTPGPASGISYTCNLYGGYRTLLSVPGIVPCNRHRDMDWDIDAVGVSTEWNGAIVGGIIRADIYEDKATTNCSSSLQAFVNRATNAIAGLGSSIANYVHRVIDWLSRVPVRQRRFAP